MMSPSNNIYQLNEILAVNEDYIFVYDPQEIPYSGPPHKRWRHPCGNCGLATRVGWAGTVCHRRGCTTWANKREKKLPLYTRRWRQYHWDKQVEINKRTVDMKQYRTKSQSKLPPRIWRHPCINCWNPCDPAYNGVTCKACGGSEKKRDSKLEEHVMDYRIKCWEKLSG